MLYTHTRTHVHPHSVGTSYLLPTCVVLVHVYIFCNTLKKSRSSLISIMMSAVKSSQATLVQNSCPAQEAKALGLALEPFLGLPAARGFRCSTESRGEEAVRARVGAPALRYRSSSHQTHNLPFSQSWGHASQRAEDKQFLLSEK